MKKRIIIYIISITCLLLAYGIAHSDVLIFSDDFERTDIGGDWTTGAPGHTNTIALVGGRVQATADGNFIETVQEFSGNLRIERDLEKVGSSDHTCWDFGVGLDDLNQYSGLIRFDWSGVDGVAIGPSGCGDDVTIPSGVNKGKAIFTYQDGTVGFSFENDDGDIIDAGSVYAGNFGSSKIKIHLAADPDSPRYVDNVKVYSLPVQPVVAICEGDFDHDGDVDGSDLAVFATDFGRTDCSDDCEGDFDNDNDVDGSDLAVFAADFGRTDCPLIQITNHPAEDGAPAWSPNNSKIAFRSNRSDVSSIWVMNTNGTNKLQLTDNLGTEGHPHWNTDSAKLVFHSNRSGNWDIWMMDSDGLNPMQLTDDPANDNKPDFSPDGSAVIFESNRSGNYDIWTMDSNGADPAQITAAPENERHPHFSPDGSKIVYKSDVRGNNDIWTMGSDGSNAVQLTNTPENEGHPHFSPDGSKIVFWSERTGNIEVWMMKADGSEQTQLTDNPANDGGANWSPDGDKIIFRSDRAGNDDIWIYNLW